MATDQATQSHADQPAFWSQSLETLYGQLQSSDKGLTQAEAAQRLQRFGPNSAQTTQQHSSLRLLWNQIKSPLVLLLLFAMTLSLFLGETTDAIIVFCVVAGSALLGFWQEYRANDAVAHLLGMISTKVPVLRDGNAVDLPIEQIVPGDVLSLSAGDTIPADCALISEKDAFIDEAALTGESYPVEKHAGVLPADTALAQRNNTLFQGTHVVSGVVMALVVHTGRQTEFGAIAQRLQVAPPETEFERGIRVFGDMLIRVTLILVMGIFAINVFFHKPVIDAFLFALALAVGLAPELLPAIVSITLSNGAQRMAKEKVIVKRLAAIENFGSMNVLCSDKTGTLTKGLVNVHAGFDPNGQTSQQVLDYACLNALFESGFVNPIDAALRKLDQSSALQTQYRKVDEVPYDFIRKRLSIVVEQTDDHNATHRHTLITKGAFKNVFEICTSVATQGKTEPIVPMRDVLLKRYEDYSNQGYRVLGVAWRDVTGDPLINKDDETDMVFAGYLLLEDPIKDDVVATLQELNGLGIGLKMITGDNRHVALTIGQQVGMRQPKVLTGSDLHQLSEAALVSRCNDINVFAEIEPNQKESILRALRKAGNVVGYIGDGINDAAALHAADVGISVEGAVDVARAAADIVLLEPNLKVLAQGVRDGRATFANTLKYIFITTSANFGNMFSMAAASLFLPFLPLLPKQILLNNFLSDLPSMAMATDNVDPELVNTPRRWDIKFIRYFMVVFGLISSVFDILCFVVLMLVLRAPERRFQTGWFIESLLTELFVALIIRTRRPFFKSRPGKMLFGATMLVVAVCLVLPYTGLGALFGLVPLPPIYIAVLLVITLFYGLTTELAKRFVFQNR